MDALPPMERRILGVLIEKALTAATPEPLTLNSIVLGCNQKSNRDPLVNYEEPEVDEALTQLQRQGLVFHLTGSRTDRWRHNAYDAWKLGKAEVALIAELLLRGPQTAAEAKSRAARMEAIPSEQFNEVLRDLINRGFVQWVTPEAKRGAILTHHFYTPNEFNVIKARFAGHEVATEAEPPPTIMTKSLATPIPTPVNDPRLDEAIEQIAKLNQRVTALEETLKALQQSLGG